MMDGTDTLKKFNKMQNNEKMQMHQKSKPSLHDYTAQLWKPKVIKK